MQKCPRNTEPGVKGSGGGRAIPSPVQSLAGHTLGITQISEPGTVCGTGSRVPLGIKADISFGCCAVNFRARFCSLFGQGWGNRRVLYSLPHFCPAGSRKSGSSEIMGRKTTAWYLRLRIQGIVFLLFKLILRDGSRDKELIWKLSSTLTSEAQTISCFAELQQTSTLKKAPQYLFSGQSKQFSSFYFKPQQIFFPFHFLCKLKARDTQVYT